MSFNLLEKPWIPVTERPGSVAQYNILDVLKKAQNLLEINEPSPLMQFGLYRFLVAFVMDAFQIRDPNDVESLIDANQFEEQTLDSYGKKWLDRFDIFDETHPFYQSRSNLSQEKQKSVAELFQELPTGTNITHFTHFGEDAHAISPAACARALCAIPPFMQAGGQGLSPSVNGIPPIYVLIKGRSLFQTIVLNCCGIDMPENTGREPVAWKLDGSIEKGKEINVFSTLQGLTWQPRHVHLIPTDGGICTYTGLQSDILVKKIIFTKGWKATGKWRDPNISYRISKDGPFALRPQEGREIWRDTGPLLLLREGSYTSPNGKFKFDKPRVVQQFSYLKNSKTIAPDQKLKVDLYTLRTDQAKIFEWQQEKLALPLNLIENDAKGHLVQVALDKTEKISWALGKAIEHMYPREGKGNDKAFENLKNLAFFKYWSSLETPFLTDLISLVAEQDETNIDAPAKIDGAWKEILQKVSKSVIEEVIGHLDANAEMLKKQVSARGLFWSIFYKMFNEGIAEKESQKSKKKQKK